ncbi:MAG: UvrB/UvrC motif-containing protein [Planctomycetes bacterium]|nr:UvrB/UvrC motif-containing protein [Planctomycetota bacterium]
MMCQRCKKKRASVRVTDVATKTEIWLCEECAQKEGVTLKSQVSLADFLAGLIKAPVTKEMARLAKLKCPECGITYLEFQSKGRFGCPNDYEVFSKLVEPLLDKIHGSTRHVGKRPAGTPPPADKGASLSALKSALETAVKAERYEDAAKIRDEIRSLKDKESGA